MEKTSTFRHRILSKVLAFFIIVGGNNQNYEVIIQLSTGVFGGNVMYN